MLRYFLVSVILLIRTTLGEWIDSSVHAGSRCTIDRVPIEALSKAEFVQFYEEQYPVILQGTTQTRLASLTEKVRHCETVSCIQILGVRHCFLV